MQWLRPLFPWTHISHLFLIFETEIFRNFIKFFHTYHLGGSSYIIKVNRSTLVPHSTTNLIDTTPTRSLLSPIHCHGNILRPAGWSCSIGNALGYQTEWNGTFEGPIRFEFCICWNNGWTPIAMRFYGSRCPPWNLSSRTKYDNKGHLSLISTITKKFPYERWMKPKMPNTALWSNWTITSVELINILWCQARAITYGLLTGDNPCIYTFAIIMCACRFGYSNFNQRGE